MKQLTERELGEMIMNSASGTILQFSAGDETQGPGKGIVLDKAVRIPYESEGAVGITIESGEAQ